MEKHDFYSLPRSIQDRMIEAAQAVSAPLPLGFIPQRQSKSLVWGLAALAIAGGWAAFTLYGLGDLSSAFAITSWGQRIVHILFAVLATLCALLAYAKSWGDERMPYQPGTYLFPGALIQATFGDLVVHDAAQLSSVSTSGADLIVKIGGSTFRFPQGSPDMATIAAEKAKVGMERWKASDPTDQLERARLSPLVDSGIQNPLAPTQAHERPKFLGVGVLLGISVVVGVFVGHGVAVWRDSLSQKGLYKAAITANTTDAYRAYIERGGSRPEVKRLLLPRAELKQAITQGSVEAIEKFVANNPQTEISGEVHNALRAALLTELAAARAKGTLRALSDLSQRYKDSPLIESELSAARHEIYQRALAAFESRASSKDEHLIPFMRQVISYAEQHGPTVHLRVHQDFSQDAENLDQIVIKNHEYYMGVKSHPSRYVLGESARRREKALLDAVVAKLQPEFSEEILKFEPLPLPGAANEKLGEASVPTLTFIHKERMSGGYVGGKPRAMYMGVAMTMTALAELPGVAEPAMRFDWSAWRNPDFSILVDSSKDIPDIYEDMIGGAFSSFTEKYLARWY
jgi:hypothetical protein